MSSPLPLPTADQLPPEEAQRLRERPPINVYRMMANAPGSLIPFTDMIKAAYHSSLPARLREVAILRQAARARAPYEIHQHRLIALANGLSEAEIAEIVGLGLAASLSQREQLTCAVADQLEETATLDEELYEKARAEFSPQEFVELVLLIGLYCSVARLLNATRVPIETDTPLANATSPN